MKTIGALLLIGGLLFAISRGIYRYYSDVDYTNTVGFNWDLAEKASTIEQKSKYINAFVAALEKQNLDGTNSNLFSVTPSTGFDENMLALKSLRQRLDSIKTMDENGFAYQTAIQQITEQEQGGADQMLRVFQGCYDRENFYTVWNPILMWVFLSLQILMVLIGGAMLMD